MKVCFKCKKEKLLTGFYKHSGMKDGYLNKCIECAKSDVRSNYKVNSLDDAYMEKERKRSRQKNRKPGKANHEANAKYAIKYPEKKEAKNRSQHINKPFVGAEIHHWSYREEHYKDIIFLIKKEHKKGHRFIIYDQERMMYRRYDTHELLDTKDAHEKFIRDCIKNKED